MKKPMISLLLCVSVVASAPVAFAERGMSYQDRQLLEAYKKKSRGHEQSQSHRSKANAPSRSQKAAPRRVAPKPQKYRAPAHRAPARPPVHRAPVYRAPARPPVHRAPVYRPPVHRAPVRSGNIYERKAQMQRRIKRGVDNGQLRRPEARELRLELNRIERHLSKYRADGNLSHREINQLNYELDALQRHIERKQNNRYRR